MKSRKRRKNKHGRLSIYIWVYFLCCLFNDNYAYSEIFGMDSKNGPSSKQTKIRRLVQKLTPQQKPEQHRLYFVYLHDFRFYLEIIVCFMRFSRFIYGIPVFNPSQLIPTNSLIFANSFPFAVSLFPPNSRITFSISQVSLSLLISRIRLL